MINIVFEFSLELTKKVITKMYVSVNDVPFPDSHWTDFTAVVLGWWANEFIAQTEGSKFGHYTFMDGSFLFETEFKDDGMMLVEFKESGLNKTNLVYSAEVSVCDFLKTLKQSMDSVLRECKRHNIESSDVDELERNYNKIMSMRRR